jgi:hypothetical protein
VAIVGASNRKGSFVSFVAEIDGPDVHKAGERP